MVNISEIYQKYKIMPILASHQIKVAAVALAICESLEEKVDEDSVVLACLFHDMGNIIKSNLDYFSEENISNKEYWKEVKREYIERYGNEEHKATYEIAKELNLSEKVINIIKTIDSKDIVELKDSLNLEDKLCIYCDNRVAPFNVVSIEDRNEEIKKRYEKHPNNFNGDKRDFFMKNLREIEKQIFSKSKIKPEDLNDDFIEKYIEIIKNKF